VTEKKRYFGINTQDLVPSRGVPRGWSHPMQLKAGEDIDALIDREGLMSQSITESLPFGSIIVEIQRGTNDAVVPTYDIILPKYRCLPLIIEVDIERLKQKSKEQIYAVYERASLIALIHAFKKYGLNHEPLESRLAQNTAV
jgi:hypothetical protein